MQDRINARVLHMHDVEDNWNKCSEFVPEKSEIIVYDIDDNHSYPRFKIGDGKTTVTNLQFTVESELKNLFTIRDEVMYIDSGYIG